MQYQVVVTGNRSLYRSIYESIDRTTTHRTATGAARSLLKVERDSKDWAKACGRWGGYNLHINGKALDPGDIYFAVERAVDNRNWTDPVTALAKSISELAAD